MSRRLNKLLVPSIACLLLAAPLAGCGSDFSCPAGTEKMRCGLVGIPEFQDPNPDRCSTCRLPDGTFHGPYEISRSDGSVKVRGFYFQGERCGTWRTYDSEGGVTSRQAYDPCGPFNYLSPV